MLIYKVLETIELSIMGRKKLYIKGSEVTEDTYIITYPEYFKKIGSIEGLTRYLSNIKIIKDPIEEFIIKESNRKAKKEIASINISKIELDVPMDKIIEVNEIEDLVKIESKEIE